MSGKQSGSSDPGARHGYATFVIQWDSMMLGCLPPKTLRYCFYPSDKGTMIQTDGNTEGLQIALPSGTYKLIVFNSDAKGMRFNYMNEFDLAEVVMPTDKDSYNNSSVSPLYAAVVNNITIDTEANSQYTVSMSPVMQRICVKVNVENTNNIEMCEASISEVVPSLNFSTQAAGLSSMVTLPFRMERSEDGFTKELMLLEVLTGSIDSFHLPNHFKLDFVLKDGTTLTSAVNFGNSLTKVMQNNILIEIDTSIDYPLSPGIVFNNWEVRAGETNASASLL